MVAGTIPTLPQAPPATPREPVAAASPLPRGAAAKRISVAAVLTAACFLLLFWTPLRTLARDWWLDPDAQHGLLLAPVALYLAWKRGIAPRARAQPVAGAILLAAAVLLRYVAGLAAELYTMRGSMLLALAGIVVFYLGTAQLRHWWLPAGLLLLSVPLPAVVLGSLALPLQLEASRLGTALLQWRDVPVQLTGNIIRLPGRSLFVTEACSGLHSLLALLSLGLLIGGLWLRTPAGRVLLLAAALPVGILLNGIRVFLTGFLVYFVSPELGGGMLHLTEGWFTFVVAFGILGGLAWLVARAERLARGRA